MLQENLNPIATAPCKRTQRSQSEFIPNNKRRRT